MSQKSCSAIAVVGIDIGKNSFHIVGHDSPWSIVLQQKWSRGLVERDLPTSHRAYKTSDSAPSHQRRSE